MFEATRPGGQMLLANTQFETGEPLRPCIICTYRQPFLNVGYELNAEKILPGEKHGVSLEALMSLFLAKSTQWVEPLHEAASAAGESLHRLCCADPPMDIVSHCGPVAGEFEPRGGSGESLLKI